MEAVASTLAAFRPETKQRLIATRLLMPTVQMIFRSSNQMVAEPDDYLTGAAHPSVFDGKQINMEKMVRLAHEITPDDIPPLVQLEMREEDLGVPGEDFFTPGATEKLFDTPAAIARVWRDRAYRRRMVVSAEASRDANGRPLTWHWQVLRGDPQRVKITPVNDDASVVEIVAEYPQYAPVTEGSKLRSGRIDIGVFVHNGKYYSAPGFVCLSAIPSEKREYDDAGRIRVIDYADPEWSKHYTDPMLYASRNWRDEYHYDDAGEMTGWTRVRGEDRQAFTADGWRVLETDDEGRPVRAREVVYVAAAKRNQAPRLQQRDDDNVRHYRYDGDSDEPRITVEPAE
jgi:hypothetical protein